MQRSGEGPRRPAWSIARIGGVLAGLVALFALAGWVVGALRWAAVGTGFVPMAPNTALCFLALVLAVLWRSGGQRSDWARAPALATALLAAATLLLRLHPAAWDIDELLIRGHAAKGSLEVGAMSAITAAGFLPLALALALDGAAPGRARLRNALAISSLLLGALFVLGYVLKQPLLYGTPVIPLALPTAVCFVLVGTAVLALPPHDVWPTQLVLGGSARARLLRTFVPLVVAVVVVQSWIGSFITPRGPHTALVAALLAGAATLAGGWVVARVAVALGARVERAERLAQESQQQRDATTDALHQMEEQLRLAQRMEAIGRLAGGVAHDFNNMLSVIITQTDVALEQATDAQREPLLEVREAAVRSADLSRQLLAVSRRQVLAPIVFEPNQLIEEMTKMLKRIVGDDVRLETQLATNAGRVEADPSQLEQVLMNLVVNARDAMPDGGTILIETSLAGEGALPEVVIALRDTGCGMDPQIIEHMFEPFFTTKRGQGSGLGLSIVYGIVQQSGGRIEVDSEPGKGTALRVFLPGTDRPLTRSIRPSSRPPPGEREQRSVLLVEDEVLVRRAARRVLSGGGYTVLEAGDGRAALALVEQHAGTFDAVVSDLSMPGMDGRVLVKKLRARLPDLAVVLMSGFVRERVLDLEQLGARAEFINKPFTKSTLLAALDRALASPPAPSASVAPAIPAPAPGRA